MRRRGSDAGVDESGFLRPRGDAPKPGARASLRASVPPPTRRCAVHILGDLVHRDGSSAHAEMRPRGPCVRWPSPGFLRPRGDAPTPRARARARARVPPPTRRCALDGSDHAVHVGGSSAHAEMRRGLGHRDMLDEGFLRPRGDAPPRRRPRRLQLRVPPPTRRCAEAPPEKAKDGLGSSAHAEMRPIGHQCGDCRCRFLRPRGDAPLPPPDAHVRLIGSSAHAEMRRRFREVGAARTRFLRPRGDAPPSDWSGTPPAKVPPPTRRCAAEGEPHAGTLRGSSAHAEMRPSRRRRATRSGGFLRPRGDAPSSMTDRRPTFAVPPPTRRCAGPGSRVRRGDQGSSAHAEMRPRRITPDPEPSRFLRPRGDAPNVALTA